MKNQKVAILTYHFAINYGAILQCYALYQTLSSLGYSVEILNYKPKKLCAKNYSPLKKVVKSFLNRSKRKEALRTLEKSLGFDDAQAHMQRIAATTLNFEQFRKDHFIESEFCSDDTIAEIANNYDTIIVGSDQVWSYYYQDNPIYFLEWTPRFIGKRVAYAPCSGKNYSEPTQKTTLQESLNRFTALSARNKHTQEMVADLIQSTPPRVADPTLLLDFSHLLIANHPLTPKPYILVYIIGDEINGGHSSMIAEIKKEVGDCTVIALVLAPKQTTALPWADTVLWEATPQEWVTLVANATFLYTDSFHGTLFSLKFERPFIAYYSEEDRKDRFIDIAQTYDLPRAIVSSVADAKSKSSFSTSIDFKRVHSIIDAQVSLSVSYLKEALEK